jgi:hypothetical protein
VRRCQIARAQLRAGELTISVLLKAAAQHQLFAGIDNLASPGSHVAVEEGLPAVAR